METLPGADRKVCKIKKKTVSSELMPEVCITEYVAIQKLTSDGCKLFICIL